MSKSEVFSATYLTKVSRKGELLQRLGDLHAVLRDLSQEPSDRPEGLQRTAAQLISPRIMGNQDKDLRLMSCVCVVDIFRLFAPEAPFTEEEMVTVFEAILTQLRALATVVDVGEGTGAKIMYILTSLATVKTCVVPVLLAQGGVAGAEELVQSMFEALISNVRSEHSEEGVCVCVKKKSNFVSLCVSSRSLCFCIYYGA